MARSGCAVAYFTLSFCPGLIFEPEILFFFLSFSTVVLLRLAISESVSPFLTVVEEFFSVFFEKVHILARCHFLFPGLHCMVLIVGIQELASRDGVFPNAKQYRLICGLSVGADRASHEQ